MSRWEPNARERLKYAGLTSFEERGYEQTTVAEIARTAGLTERTFFRYFADKREVLFDGTELLVELMERSVLDAPAELSPRAAIGRALDATEAYFAGRRPWAARRQAVLTANPVLMERELLKINTLTEAVAGALRARGVGEPAATVAAEVGVLVFRVGFVRWTETDGLALRDAYAQTYALVETQALDPHHPKQSRVQVRDRVDQLDASLDQDG